MGHLLSLVAITLPQLLAKKLLFLEELVLIFRNLSMIFIFGTSVSFLFFIYYFNIFLTLRIQEQLQWSTIQASGATPSPRFNHIAEVIDDKLYVIGGTDGKRLFNDVHILDLTNNVWSSPQTIGGIPGVSGASSFVHDRKIIFFGGETSNGVSDICFAFQPGKLIFFL